MKNIAVSESAYERLNSWKTGKRDSFSKVIERLIPPKGTFESAVRAAKHLPELTENKINDMEKALDATRQSISEPWKL